MSDDKSTSWFSLRTPDSDGLVEDDDDSVIYDEGGPQSSFQDMGEEEDE